MRHFITAAMTAFLLLGVQAALAQGFPSKPIKVLVPHSVGGSPDSMARIVAQKASEILGQPVIVETRIGAGGMVGTNAVIGSPADGYSLLFADSSAYAITPHMYRNVAFDPLKNLVPIAPAATVPLVLAVHPGLNVSTLNEFLALARSKPDLFYGSSGNGTPHHLGMELLKSLTGIDLKSVPYKGSAQAVLALTSGEISVAFLGLQSALPLAKAGKLKILAVSPNRRLTQVPEIPTIAEAGVPNFELTTVLGFFAPPKTPPAVVAKLHADLTKAIRSYEVQQRLLTLGLDTAPEMTPEQYGRFSHEEYEKYGKLVKSTGAYAD
jgi:tripartite-type tricarboxylate transporter receptor subunit TctC